MLGVLFRAIYKHIITIIQLLLRWGSTQGTGYLNQTSPFNVIWVHSEVSTSQAKDVEFRVRHVSLVVEVWSAEFKV